MKDLPVILSVRSDSIFSSVVVEMMFHFSYFSFFP